MTGDMVALPKLDDAAPGDPRIACAEAGHLGDAKPVGGGVSEVARAAGLNRESLYKIFNGKAQPKWDTVRRLMRALHVDLTIAA